MEEQNYPQQKQYDKGSAPRVTRQDATEAISSFVIVNGYSAAERAQAGEGALDENLRRVTLCLMTLRNGAVVLGSSTCAHMDNFHEQKGRDAAYDDAFRQAWNLMGYALRDRLGTMSHYQDLHGVTRDADGEESFEQLKWNTPQGGLPYKNFVKVEVGEPSAPLDLSAMASTGDNKPVPEDAETMFGSGVFIDGKPVGKLYNVRLDSEGVWRADMKVDEEARRQSEIEFLKIFEDPAAPYMRPSMKPPRLTAVLKASREYEASKDNKTRAGHTDSSASMQYKGPSIGMRESFDKVIRNMTEEIAAAYRLPVRLLMEPIKANVTFTPANDGETLEEVKKRVTEAIQSVIKGDTKKVKHLPAIAKGAHVALHGGKADPYPLDLPELVEAYFLGYNMVYRSGDYGLEWDKRVHAITRQYACLADQRAEGQFIELVKEYMAKP